MKNPTDLLQREKAGTELSLARRRQADGRDKILRPAMRFGPPAMNRSPVWGVDAAVHSCDVRLWIHQRPRAEQKLKTIRT